MLLVVASISIPCGLVFVRDPPEANALQLKEALSSDESKTIAVADPEKVGVALIGVGNETIARTLVVEFAKAGILVLN